MIEFFQFLNNCSPARALSYMIFILIIIFLSYAFIESLLKIIFGIDEENEDISGVLDDGDSMD